MIRRSQVMGSGCSVNPWETANSSGIMLLMTKIEQLPVTRTEEKETRL